MIEHETEATLSREDAAARLRELADMLSKQNAVTFDLDGLKTTLKVPGEVSWSIEIEVTDDGGEIEVEISW
jgi:amphi-Trp domain-containing protein